MKSRGSRWTAHARPSAALAALAVLGAGIGGLTQAAGESPLPAHLSGLFNDYTPLVAGNLYEMHGKWSLDLDQERGAARFTAEMTMETADFVNSGSGYDPTALGAHTHHVSVKDGMIHNDPADSINWKTACPTTLKPPVTGGFVVTGTAYVTGNGANPPFGNPSPVTICILGGMQNPSITGAQAYVEFSNFTLKFGSPASSHFGMQPINGVVARCEGPWNRETSDCRVSIVE
jgi:hypothetical protein